MYHSLEGGGGGGGGKREKQEEKKKEDDYQSDMKTSMSKIMKCLVEQWGTSWESIAMYEQWGTSWECCLCMNSEGLVESVAYVWTVRD